ncbi:MAG: hypothetical protein U1F66_11900 [bacterium]
MELCPLQGPDEPGADQCFVPEDPEEFARASDYYSPIEQFCYAPLDVLRPYPAALAAMPLSRPPQGFYERAMDIDGWWDDMSLPGKIGGLIFVGSARALGLAALVLIPSDSRIKPMEETLAEQDTGAKKRAELDLARKKYGDDEAFLEQLRQPIRDHFDLLEGVALQKFDASLRVAPWIKILLAKCPHQDAMLEEWKRLVPAMDTRLGKIHAFFFQEGIPAGDPILAGTEFGDAGLKGIIELCWGGTLPAELQGLKMPAAFVPPPEFPTWTKENRDLEPE